MKEFKQDKWTLNEAIDALMAWDLGCVDSGVKDARLKRSVGEYLKSLDDKEFRFATGEFARKYLSEEGLSKGYGLEDVRSFIRWLDEEFGIYI